MLIGLSGKIGCGKSYLSNYFIDENPEYIRIGFADVLKKECSETYDYFLEWNYSEEGKGMIVNHPDLPRKNMLVREILQWHGTDYRREQDPDYWIRKMIDILLAEEIPKTVIIDDIRFINEAEMIKGAGGLLVRIWPYPEWKPGPYADHKSETELDNYAEFDLILTPEFGQLKECVPAIEQLIKEK